MRIIILTIRDIVDDIGQLTSFQRIAEVNSFTMCAIAVLVHWLKMDAQKTHVLWLYRNTEEQAFMGRGPRAWYGAYLSAKVRAVLANSDPLMRTTRS